ncbi:MAG: metallophosphoesterase [Mucilaginibacter sp.]|nr:metallophosphoesterase [Mucilaginibacter sp.]
MKYKYLLTLILCICLQVLQAQDKQPDNLFIAKPYLQIGREPSAESLGLLWHVDDANANWSVEHHNGSTGEWKKAESPVYSRVVVKGVEPHRVYHAKLTGLTPGGVFTYRLLKDGKVVFTAEGKAPKSATQSYRFVAFGDIGAETPDQKLLAIRAFKAKPDLVVIPGDIVYENGLISEYRSKFWNVYNADQENAQGAPIMRSVPFVAATGNHDSDNRDLDKFPDGLAYYMFWDQPLNGPVGAEGNAWIPALKASEANRKAFLDAAGDSYPRMTNYSFNYGNAHWTVVDSNPYVDWTDKELNDWVKNDLASPAAKNATWRFVLFHHPGFSSSREHYEQQHMRLLSPILEAGNVDVVFNGHVHNYQRSFPLTFTPDKQGTLMVGGKDGKIVRGRVVPGSWKLDKAFDGKTITKPKGIIYLVTGAGGQDLYNPEQNDDQDSWQKFTDKFISNVHSLTVADVNGKTLLIKQISAEGKELDTFTVTK